MSVFSGLQNISHEMTLTGLPGLLSGSRSKEGMEH